MWVTGAGQSAHTRSPRACPAQTTRTARTTISRGSSSGSAQPASAAHRRRRLSHAPRRTWPRHTRRLGLEEPPDVLPVLEVVLRAQVEVKAKLEVLEELAPARASGNELTPGLMTQNDKPNCPLRTTTRTAQGLHARTCSWCTSCPLPVCVLHSNASSLRGRGCYSPCRNPSSLMACMD